jgi:Flp pilus assembly protein TadB
MIAMVMGYIQQAAAASASALALACTSQSQRRARARHAAPTTSAKQARTLSIRHAREEGAESKLIRFEREKGAESKLIRFERQSETRLSIAPARRTFPVLDPNMSRRPSVLAHPARA